MTIASGAASSKARYCMFPTLRFRTEFIGEICFESFAGCSIVVGFTWSPLEALATKFLAALSLKVCQTAHKPVLCRVEQQLDHSAFNLSSSPKRQPKSVS